MAVYFITGNYKVILIILILITVWRIFLHKLFHYRIEYTVEINRNLSIKQPKRIEAHGSKMIIV